MKAFSWFIQRFCHHFANCMSAFNLKAALVMFGAGVIALVASWTSVTIPIAVVVGISTVVTLIYFAVKLIKSLFEEDQKSVAEITALKAQVQAFNETKASISLSFDPSNIVCWWTEQHWCRVRVDNKGPAVARATRVMIENLSPDVLGGGSVFPSRILRKGAVDGVEPSPEIEVGMYDYWDVFSWEVLDNRCIIHLKATERAYGDYIATPLDLGKCPNQSCTLKLRVFSANALNGSSAYWFAVSYRPGDAEPVFTQVSKPTEPDVATSP